MESHSKYQRQTDERQTRIADPQRLMNLNQCQVLRGGGRDHAHADEQHGEDADCHEPVKQLLRCGEARAAGCYWSPSVAVRG